MTLQEAIRARHSVRAYTDQPIDADTRLHLAKMCFDLNRESGLRIQPIFDEPKAFSGPIARYGRFSGVNNYFAAVGPKDAPEAVGRCGEMLVLFAQQLGLNTCWVGLTLGKTSDAYEVSEGEKLHALIAVGYGVTQGASRRSKSVGDVSRAPEDAPKWFRAGVEAALLAPTAMNQQKFTFSLNGNRVAAKAGFGPFAKLDLGIVKCHFQIGAGEENFEWA